jgi:hypothetical protein
MVDRAVEELLDVHIEVGQFQQAQRYGDDGGNAQADPVVQGT